MIIVRVELPESTLHLRCSSRAEARRWVAGMHGAIPAAEARLVTLTQEEALRVACLGSAIKTVRAERLLEPVAPVAQRPLIDRERLFAALGR